MFTIMSLVVCSPQQSRTVIICGGEIIFAIWSREYSETCVSRPNVIWLTDIILNLASDVADSRVVRKTHDDAIAF